MNARIKKLWIKALRSGKYKQATGQLREDNGEPKFCCLGVLCDLHSKTKEGQQWIGTRYFGNSGSLPFEVTEWSGIGKGDELGEVYDSNGKERYTLAGKNDEGRSFRQIADLIERNF